MPLAIVYKGLQLDCGYRLDIVVQRELIIEIKAVEQLMPIRDAQILTYLRPSGHKVGLLINFNEVLLKMGSVGSFCNLCALCVSVVSY
jgi:GxxExxY protein